MEGEGRIYWYQFDGYSIYRTNEPIIKRLITHLLNEECGCMMEEYLEYSIN